jgi:hypothetical protein
LPRAEHPVATPPLLIEEELAQQPDFRINVATLNY